MKKLVTKPLIAAALMASVAGVSSVPSVVGAQSGRDWNNNSWRDNNHWRRDDNRRHVSNWEARNTAQRFFPGRHIVGEEDRWDNNGRHEHRFRFDDNHCVDVRDDGVVIRIFIIVVQR